MIFRGVIGMFVMLALQVGKAGILPGEAWTNNLAMMRVAPGAIGRSNAIPVILQSYRPDAVVGGIVFLPSVCDQFYLIERGKPLEIAGSNLWEVIAALTNQTSVRATFIEPFLIVHMARDQLTPRIKIAHRPSALQLQQTTRWPDLFLIDQHWERVQPELNRRWQRKVTPAKSSEDAWHFGRNNVVGAYLTDWQVLQALSLTSHTTVTINRKSLGFSPRQGL